MNYPPIPDSSSNSTLFYLVPVVWNVFVFIVVVTIFIAAVLYIRNNWRRK